MSVVAALVGRVLREVVRERVPHVAGLYVVGFAILAPWVASVSLGAPTRAVRELGLTSMWAVACLVAIGLGVRHVGGELASRRAALWLARPIGRRRWMLGRLTGVGVALAALVGALLVAYVLVAGIERSRVGGPLAIHGLLLWAECCVLASVAALLGVLARPALAGACTVGIWVGGHLADEYARVAGPVLPRLVYVVVPDLDLFVVQEELVHELAIAPGRVIWALGYGALWVVALLALTALALERRDVA